MKKWILLAMMIMLCTVFQGCVGFVVQKRHTEVINNPVVSPQRTDEVPAKTRDQTRKEMISSDPNEATNQVVWDVYTSAWLQTHWGKPNRKGHAPAGSGSGPGAGADEVWTYRFGPIWEGVVPWLIIPIPLELPFGEKTVCFTLRDGKVVSMSSTKPASSGFFWPKRL